MGHRFATLSGCALGALCLGAVLTLVPTTAVGATEPGGSAPGDEPGGTLLPPEGDMSIVPTDEAPDQPVEPRTFTDPGDRSGLVDLDLDDVGPVAIAGWALAALVSALATAIALTRLTRMLYAWRSPASLGASGFGPLCSHTTASFSLLVPARRAAPGLGHTLDQLALLDHPAFEVVAVVGYDDLSSRSAAVAAAARHPERVRVFVDRSNRRSRAASLNAALTECLGAVVGVFEPGDEVHPRLLRHVDSCLADPDVGAVQGGVRHVVTRSRWFAARSVVDQYFRSRSRLHFHARQRFTPLESTTVFVRGQVLKDAGGWDPRCADEAGELGVRLSVQGTPITVAYDPELATRTSAPTTVRELVALHTRRIRGSLQTRRMGVWRDLPTRRQRRRARSMLARPLVEAVATPAVLGALAGVLVTGAPTALVVLAILPLLPVPVAIGAELAGLSELGRLDGRRVHLRDRVGLVVSFLPYDLLVSAAALSALVGELRGTDVRQPSVPVAPPRTKRRRGEQRLQGIVDDDPDAAEVVDMFDRRGQPVGAGGGLRAVGTRER